jgi:hypothetical protein
VYFSPEEFHTVLLALAKAEKARLKLAAKWLSRGLQCEWEDLLQEAIQRTLAGTRRCPIHVPVVVFLIQAMRSIRSQWMNDQNRENDATSESSQIAAILEKAKTSSLEELDSCELVAAAREHLAGDDKALKFLESRLKELTRRECMRRFGWSETEYETVRRRFNRKMERLGEQLRAENERDSTEESDR